MAYVYAQRPSPGLVQCSVQNVPSGIQIAVDLKAAIRTAMNTNTERFMNNRATPGAYLRGEAGINCYHDRSGAFSLVSEKGKQLSPGGVVYALGEFRSGKSKDVQVLDGNQAKLVGQTIGELVVEVGPLVGDLEVGLGDLDSGLVPARRSFLPAGQPALLDAQFPLALPEEARRFHQFAGGQGGDSGHTEIDTNWIAGMFYRFGVGEFQAERYEPVARRSLADKPRRLDLGTVGNWSVLKDAHVADILDSQSPILGEADAVAEGVLDRCPTVLGLEPGIARASEKSVKRPGEPSERALHRGKVEKGKVQLKAKVLDLISLVVVIQAHLTGAPEIPSLVKRHIIKLAMQVKNAFKQLILFFVRADPVPVRKVQSLFPIHVSEHGWQVLPRRSAFAACQMPRMQDLYSILERA